MEPRAPTAPTAVSIRSVVRTLTRDLEPRAGDEAQIEAEVLVRHQLGLTRAQLIARGNETFDPEQRAALRRAVERRLRGEPLAYLTGRREFFGLDFAVDARVLIPRPETELLVETALEWFRGVAADTARWPTPIRFADVGTGSGAIAVSLLKHAPGLVGYALDMALGALAVARENAARHGVAGCLEFIESDLLGGLPQPVELLVANLPYVRDDALPRWCGATQVELAFEPALALEGGTDGLDLIRRFLHQAPRYLRPGGLLLLEIGADQGSPAVALVQQAFPTGRVSLRKDLAGRPRLVAAAV